MAPHYIMAPTDISLSLVDEWKYAQIPSLVVKSELLLLFACVCSHHSNLSYMLVKIIDNLQRDVADLCS